MSEPMSAQIAAHEHYLRVRSELNDVLDRTLVAAHEHYLRVRSELNDVLDRGDERAVGKLRAQLERAERDWHRLVRAAEDAQRDTRPR